MPFIVITHGIYRSDSKTIDYHSGFNTWWAAKKWAWKWVANYTGSAEVKWVSKNWTKPEED